MKQEEKITTLFRAILILLSSVFVGISGFMIFERYSFSDAFYMTVITISTVGFGEVHPLSETARVFVGFYILFNIGCIGYFLSVTSKFLFEGELRNIFKNMISDRELEGLTNHVIVCGCGRNGYKACLELKSSNVPFIIIDPKPGLIQERFGESYGEINFIEGDATDEDILLKAGINKAKAIIAAVPTDSINVFIALTARGLNDEMKIIARATQQSAENKLYRAGADFVVMPDDIGGHYMATIVNRPHVVDFLDMINGVGKQKLELEEISYDDLKTTFRDLSIRELDIRRHSSVTFVAYKKEEGYTFNPNSSVVLNPGEHFIVLGDPEELAMFKAKFTLLN